jgi:hypothetical protein
VFHKCPSTYEQPTDALRLIYVESNAIRHDIEARVSADIEAGSLYLLRTDVPAECLAASGAAKQPEGLMLSDSRQ